MSSERPLVMATEYVFPRWKAVVYGVLVGLLIGYGNTFLDVDFTLRADLLVVLVIVAIVIVVVAHEGLHGGVGMLLGHRPVFGLEPPLVYTTYKEKIPRDHLIAIALAPLVVIDTVCVALYALDVIRLFAVLCFAVNTIGALGDLWIVLKISRHPRDSLIQDTKTGVQVWSPERA
ncbi:MAG: DUF3267 domain-containing protein [Gemmatimonadota bacterium]|nr:MAG: DUF3267 domain-containing protein [Gemmatimonadota bacterium]